MQNGNKPQNNPREYTTNYYAWPC